MAYRKIFHIQEPAFALILDEDIILDHEIADKYLSGASNGIAEDSRELQLTGQSHRSSDEPAEPREMLAVPSGPDRRRVA